MSNLNPFSYKGTLTRKAYCVTFLLLLFPMGFCSGILNAVGDVANVFLLLFAILCYCMIATTAKRYRDAGCSPWYSLLGLLPIAPIIIFIYLMFKPSITDASKSSS